MPAKPIDRYSVGPGALPGSHVPRWTMRVESVVPESMWVSPIAANCCGESVAIVARVVGTKPNHLVRSASGEHQPPVIERGGESRWCRQRSCRIGVKSRRTNMHEFSHHLGPNIGISEYAHRTLSPLLLPALCQVGDGL